MQDELLAAWRANNRISFYLIEHISDEGMLCTLSKRGGRDVARQFAHLHNIRIAQLVGRAKDLAEGLEKFEGKISPSKSELRSAFEASGEAIEAFLVALAVGEPKRRGFKRGLFTALSYFVSHESHHRGNILLTLKTAGHGLDRVKQYAIWDWDRI